MRFIRTLLSSLSLLEELTANAVLPEGSVQELRLAMFPRLVGLCYREPGTTGETSRNGMVSAASPSGTSLPSYVYPHLALKTLVTRDAFEKAVLGDTTKYSVKAKYLPIIKAKSPPFAPGGCLRLQCACLISWLPPPFPRGKEELLKPCQLNSPGAVLSPVPL